MEAVNKRREPLWLVILVPALGAAGILLAGAGASASARLKGEYETEALIGAPSEGVWAILTNAEAYKDWNPEIVAIDGNLAHGEKFSAHVRLGSGKVQKVTQMVTGFEPPTQMQWTGGLPFGLFVGRRTFNVEPTDGGTRFRLHLSMTGPFSQMILKSLGDRQPEIDSFSEALKKAAEATHSG